MILDSLCNTCNKCLTQPHLTIQSVTIQICRLPSYKEC